jgi:hypothetical protein
LFPVYQYICGMKIVVGVYSVCFLKSHRLFFPHIYSCKLVIGG